MRVKCLIQEHNTIFNGQGSNQDRSIQLRFEDSNHETTGPPIVVGNCLLLGTDNVHGQSCNVGKNVNNKYGLISVVGNNSRSTLLGGGSLFSSEMKLIGNTFIFRI